MGVHPAPHFALTTPLRLIEQRLVLRALLGAPPPSGRMTQETKPYHMSPISGVLLAEANRQTMWK
jgi:hypothetical protein